MPTLAEETEDVAREIMASRHLAWDIEPAWTVCIISSTSGTRMEPLLRGRMISTLSQRTLVVEASNAMSFWSDVRETALGWLRSEN